MDYSEPHPIPQNITSFEFHLVGDMTLRQFLYLGVGVGVGYLLYATVFYSHPYISTPFIIIFVLLGLAFAFLSIFDRPLDHWIKAFFAAVYSPTKGEWKIKYNNKQILSADPLFKNRLKTYLSLAGSSLNPQESNITQKTKDPQETPRLVPSKELTQLVEMAKQAQILQTRIADTEKLIKQMRLEGKPAEIPQVSANLQSLIQQTEDLYKKTSEMNRVAASQTKTQPIAPKKQIISQKVVTANIVLTSTPNVINGIVSDQEGNYLENVIVIIHNQEGIPVRALKTNKLGQFVGSTPLSAGTYKITLEKDDYAFQTLEVSLDHSTLAPIKIIASQEAKI